MDAQNFSVNHATDPSKTSLQFRLVNQCSAYLDGGNYDEYKVTSVRSYQGRLCTNLDVFGDGTLVLSSFKVLIKPVVKPMELESRS